MMRVNLELEQAVRHIKDILLHCQVTILRAQLMRTKFCLSKLNYTHFKVRIELKTL